MKYPLATITLSLLLIVTPHFYSSNGQTTPSEYYKVVEKDSLYIF